MKKTMTSLLVGTLLAGTYAVAGDLDADNKKTSYMIRGDVGAYIKKSNIDFDGDAFMAGINDAIEGKDSQLSQAEIGKLRQALQAKQKAAQEAQRAEAMAKLEEDKVKNLDEGKVFMEKKAKDKGIKSTESGILYEVLTQGDGAKPSSPNSTVVVHYKGTLIDGKQFDSSIDRGQPATFALNQVIKGWTEGLQLMNTGSKYRFYIPPELAYGPDARPGSPIGPNSTLIFEVELIEIKDEKPE
jgi:FKBP-type peptidyl-prolyl cis-trans isomerase